MGFTEEEARRLWRVEETPGQLGIHITFDQLPAPTPRPTAAPHAADVGAQAPTNDVATTGNGASSLPQQTTEPESGPSAPGAWDGVWDGFVDVYDHLDEMVPGSAANLGPSAHGARNGRKRTKRRHH
ncbi:MAG: hypothetical protein IPM54_19675 [Polyangiaceae bacterium]|nr:hypothetical protein [Polyangiaceae bacterium]